MAATTALNHTTPLQKPGHIRFFPKNTLKSRIDQPVSTLSIISLSGLFVCSLLIYFHTVLIEYQANTTQMRIIQTKEENAILQASLAERKSLANVEKKALAFGMQAVDQYHYISLESAAYHQTDELNTIALPANQQVINPPIGF